MAVTVRRLGGAFPLVRVEVREMGTQLMVELDAPVYGEGLTRQAFALTLSSVAKAAEALELFSTEQARQAEELAKLDAEMAAREREFHAAMNQMNQSSQQRAVAAPPITPAVTPAINPIVTPVEQRCPKCGQLIPPGKRFCTGCGTRV